MCVFSLTFSALLNGTDLYANSVDPDVTAHNELSYQDPKCLQFFFDFLLRPLLIEEQLQKLKDEYCECQ